MFPSSRIRALSHGIPLDLTLEDLAKFTSLLLELHNEVAVPYVTEELYSTWVQCSPTTVSVGG